MPDEINPQAYQSEGGEPARRKPGRPPKTTAGVDNTQTNYQPSPERNNADQALQPTGDGDVAGLPEPTPFGGMGDHDDDGVVGGSKAKLFPVRLKRNYRPATDYWKIMRDDGTFGPRPTFEDGETPKVRAGFAIGLPIDEAKGIIAKGIAEREDAIE